MKNQSVKNQYLFFLLICFLLLFSIFMLDFNAEIKNHYFKSAISQLSVPEGSKRPITLIFVGDIMIDRGIEHMIETEGKGDYKYPFLKIVDYLKEADILFGNLEGPISDKGRKVGSIYSFRADPKSIEGLLFAGFDILSGANNHVFDYGIEAVKDTILRLKTAGINYVGVGLNEEEAYSPAIKQKRESALANQETKIAFLAYTALGSRNWKAKGSEPGISWLEKERMEQEIKRAEDLADIIVVSFHYGQEYSSEPTLFQISISQAAITAGADLVVGHHPHVVQPLERYKDGYIAYSLGNFIFDQSFSKETTEGLLLKVLVVDKKIKEVIPVKIEINEFFQPEVKK